MKSFLLSLIAFLLISCALPECAEQEQRLRVLLPDTEVDLRGIPSEVAEDIVNGVILVKTKYPYALKDIAKIYEEPRHDLLYAVTYLKGYYVANSLAFNGWRMQSRLSLKNQYGRDVWRGYHVRTPLNPATAITVHELGHVLMANLKLQDSKEIIELYQRYKPLAEQGKTLSRCATDNIYEFFAETFTDLVCNPKNPSDAALELRAILGSEETK